MGGRGRRGRRECGGHRHDRHDGHDRRHFAGQSHERRLNARMRASCPATRHLYWFSSSLSACKMVKLLVRYSMRKASTLMLSLISDSGWIGAICNNIHFSGFQGTRLAPLHGPPRQGGIKPCFAISCVAEQRLQIHSVQCTANISYKACSRASELNEGLQNQCQMVTSVGRSSSPPRLGSVRSWATLQAKKEICLSAMCVFSRQAEVHVPSSNPGSFPIRRSCPMFASAPVRTAIQCSNMNAI